MKAIEFCELVEGRLGWEVPTRLPRWRAMTTEAGKVNKKIATNPTLYTWDNLCLAVELLAREKLSRSPVGVFSHVDRALDLALDSEHDVEDQIREAVTYETRRGDPHGWGTRFARASGHYRRLILAEWREAAR